MTRRVPCHFSLSPIQVFSHAYSSEKDQEGEYALDTEKRNKLRTVFVTGRDGLTPQQAAILLVQEARMLVQVCNSRTSRVIVGLIVPTAILFNRVNLIIRRKSWDSSSFRGSDKTSDLSE